MSPKLTEDTNKRKGKNKTILFLYIAILLFIIWAIATIWLAMTYKLNNKNNEEKEAINSALNKKVPLINLIQKRIRLLKTRIEMT